MTTSNAPFFTHLTPLETLYPSRLRALHVPPPSLSTRGGGLEAPLALAIVGSRDAAIEALAFAHELAAEASRAGAVIVSGGAQGIDAAAHRGALDAGGRTWAVAGTGCLHCFPPEHMDLFRVIGDGPGAMIWPFAPDSVARPGSFLARNRVLVALADAVVVVQAGARSGALHTAGLARKLTKPLWVVPVAPWVRGFDGSRQLLDEGAAALTSANQLLQSLMPASAAPAVETPSPSLSDAESAILQALPSTPCHMDEIAFLAHASIHTASVALLTLALENVVVEGPPGFFRRRKAPNR